jgi:putative ABC transport system permease protein
MLSNFLKVTLRGLVRDRAYALINIGGLALGIACFIVLALYLESELTYDRHHVNHERIYRVVTELHTGGRADLAATTSRELGSLLVQDYPEIEDFVRFEPMQVARQILRHGDTVFYWDNILLADPNVFEVFTHDVLYGDPATALIDPSSIAISESMALRYFGDRDPIGETLSTNTGGYRVTLVFADLPVNTHLKYDALISYNRVTAFLGEVNVTDALWGISSYTYLVMPSRYDVRRFEAISEDFYGRYQADVGRQFDSRMRYMVQPLTSIYLNSTAQYDRPTGNKFYVYAFAAIALFVLLVACINYMNLATARASRRAKEVGMRKVVGASRGQLIVQFIGESVVFAWLGLVLAVLVAYAALGYTPVGELLGKHLSLDLTARPLLMLTLFGFASVVGIVAGAYPAFYLSAIPPMAAFRGNTRTGQRSGGTLRQALVFVQFAISVGVIAAAVLMAMQMHFVQSKPLGFDRDNLLVVRIQTADAIERVPYIKSDLAGDSRVLGVATAGSVPGENIGITFTQVENSAGMLESQTLNILGIDEDFLDVLAIELVHGRNFGPDTPRDSSVLVNETLVRQMGWDDPLGRRVFSGTFQNRVIGVMRDFHLHSLHRPVEPLFVFGFDSDLSDLDPLNRALISRILLIRIADHDVPGTLAFLRERWLDYMPAQPFEYAFLSDILDGLYASERRQMQLIAVFAGVCILISCLGLFGLAAFTTAQRTKEIGVRRILGASTIGVVALLFRQIAVLIVAASVVASIVCYYVVAQWLASFSYRQDISVWVFVLATLGALGIAFATVGLQSWRTARASPALALRSD